jgi:hypothetical protein
MVNYIKISLLMLLLLLSCSTKELARTKQILVLKFIDFVENPERFKGQVIGVQGYYVEGQPQLYKDKEFYEFVSSGGGFDSSEFNYRNIIEIPKYHKSKRPPTLSYLEGAYVIAYGRPAYLHLANNPVRYGGYLMVDSIVLLKSP